MKPVKPWHPHEDAIKSLQESAAVASSLGCIAKQPENRKEISKVDAMDAEIAQSLRRTDR